MSHFLFDNVLPRGTQLLGRYAIEAQIARGGSSTIYRALDERLDRVVCVKVYRGPLGQGLEGAAAGVDRTVFSLFRREAFALSRLQHPNTLRIYDMGVLEQEGRPFQVTEYLDGGNLEQYVRSRGPLATAEALDILGPIAAAVVEAHGFGLVHRDIKPSNILFARAGSALVPKLADFGIASSSRSLGPAESSSEAITLSGMVYSPHWAAPEQLVSKPVGPSTDVYALALLTLFMLTGSTPFYVENVLGTFLERVRGTATVEEYFAHCALSPALRGVLLEALGPDPATRLASATEFALRVGRALGAPVGAVGFAASPLPVPGAPPLPHDGRPPSPRASTGPAASSTAPLAPLPPIAPPPPAPSPRAVAPAAPAAPSPRGPAPSGAGAPRGPAPSGAGAPRGPAPSGPGATGGARGRPIAANLSAVSLTFESDEGKISPLAFREIGPPGSRPVRLAPPRDRWDLTLQASGREPLRLRATLLVMQGRSSRLHLKGLNCFVRLPSSQHASAAVFADGDGRAEFLSTGRERLAQCRWGWGRAERASAVTFSIPDEPPLELAWHGSRVALALAFDDYPDIIVLQAS